MGQIRDEMNGIQDTAKEVLSNAVAMAIAGGKALKLSPDERDAILSSREDLIDAHMLMLVECLEQASLAGANSVHRMLHKAPGVDPEMLDEAVEHASEDSEG